MRPARGRDRAGRPVAADAPERVPTQPAGAGDRARRSAAQVLDAAQLLLDAANPFAAHEVLEEAWKSAPPPERPLWRALAQLAVALTHRQRGNARGEAALLDRAAAGAAAAPETLGLDLPGILAAARAGTPVTLRAAPPSAVSD